VTLGRDVKLRSTEVDVRLDGQLSLVTSAAPGRAASSTGLPVPGLTLEGALRTVSGTYNLNLGLVQREFTVLSRGTVTFDGISSPETPLIDIRAQYNVKRQRDRDLGVIVNLHGRMPNPVIDFSSNAEYTISTSDLLSYLLTGTPGFDFASNQAQVLASFLSPTISAFTADRLRRSFGGAFDAFRFELGSYNVASDPADRFGSTARNIQNYLLGSTVAVEQPLMKDLYLTVNTGFCDIKRSIGGKLEYRFKPTLSFEMAYDPSAATRATCGEGQLGFLTLAPPPWQVSFAVRHTWRF
jgi:hypothetical protein